MLRVQLSNSDWRTTELAIKRPHDPKLDLSRIRFSEPNYRLTAVSLNKAQTIHAFQQQISPELGSIIMSVSICTDCLSRLRIAKTLSTIAPTTIPHVYSFHSSAVQYKSPLLKKKVVANKVVQPRKSTGIKMKKKSRQKPNIPAVGERRAARKRIVLSNTNALEVSGMETLSLENMGKAESEGRMLALPGEVLDQLRDSQAFKTTQNWNMFRRPATMTRSETLDIAQAVEAVGAKKGKPPSIWWRAKRAPGRVSSCFRPCRWHF